MVLQQVSFVERLSLSQRVPYRRFHCIAICIMPGDIKVVHIKRNFTISVARIIMPRDLKVVHVCINEVPL